MSDDKVRENRLRRMAERQGLSLTKSRRRDPLATDYGMVEATLTDPTNGPPTDKKETVSEMFADNIYSKLNAALIDAGMDPAKRMKNPTNADDFRTMCLELGTTPGAVCEAAGI